MRRGVVSHDIEPSRIDFERRLVSGLDGAFPDLAPVDDAVAEPLRVLDLEGAGVGPDPASIADLSSLLGVEVGLVEHEANLIPAREAAGANEVSLDPGED